MFSFFFLLCDCFSFSESEQEDTSKKGRKNKKKKVGFSALGNRDTSLSIFHGLGKVFHPKRDENGVLKTNADEIGERMSLSTSLLAHFLHENYLHFFFEAEDCCLALENLSV